MFSGRAGVLIHSTCLKMSPGELCARFSVLVGSTTVSPIHGKCGGMHAVDCVKVDQNG